MRARVFFRCILTGRWRFAGRLLGNFCYGLTHRGCRQCGNPKPWHESRCYTCQLSNMKRALFDEEFPEAPEETK